MIHTSNYSTVVQQARLNHFVRKAAPRGTRLVVLIFCINAEIIFLVLGLLTVDC